MTFTSSDVGYLGVALLIEDFLTFTSRIPLSAIPVQFLIEVADLPSGCSVVKPTLVSPASGGYFPLLVSTPFSLELLARAVSSSRQ